MSCFQISVFRRCEGLLWRILSELLQEPWRKSGVLKNMVPFLEVSVGDLTGIIARGGYSDNSNP